MDNKNKKSIFFKILISILFITTLFLLVFDYFDNKTNHFTTEIIITLGMLIIICCIDIYDSFQIGNFVSIKREKDAIEKEKKQLKEQNEYLIKFITSINNNIAINNKVIVDESTAEEKEFKAIKEEKESLEEKEQHSIKREKAIQKEDSFSKFEILKITENTLINKFLKKNKFEDADIIRQPKLRFYNQLNTIFYDCYIKNNESELFVEVKGGKVFNYYSIFKQLSYVEEYNKINNTNAKFVLILNKEFKDENQEIIKRFSNNDFFSVEFI